MREKMFYLHLEMLMPYEKGVFLFEGRNDGAHILFIENEELLRKLASFHN